MSAKKPIKKEEAKVEEKEKKKERKHLPRTKVIACKCSQAFQDKEYGKSQRLHNLAPGNKGTRCAYRCTGCRNLVE